MVKQLTKIGGSLGLIIEKPILDLLKIDKDTPIEVSTDGDKLILRPVRTITRDEVRELSAAVMDEYAETFEKLAK